MAKVKNNYEKSWFPRFLRWFRGEKDILSEQMVDDFSLTSEPFHITTIADAKRREEEYEQKRKDIELHEHDIYERVHKWSRTSGMKALRLLYILLAFGICVGSISLLLTTVSNLPSFGDADNPINNEVSERYIEKGLAETGAVNIVTGMILDYRAFDTLGESNVLFIAACSVVLLLRINREEKDEKVLRIIQSEQDDRGTEPKNDIILQKNAWILVPFIFMFGIYVILNGHISPGGGFSGGAIIGAGLILYLNAFGFKKAERFFTFNTFRAVSFGALAFYGLSKAYSFYCGANGIESGITPGTAGNIFSAGLIPYLNIAVGLVVACTMYAFYTLFRKGDM